jgi:hypothetical protein
VGVLEGQGLKQGRQLVTGHLHGRIYQEKDVSEDLHASDQGGSLPQGTCMHDSRYKMRDPCIAIVWLCMSIYVGNSRAS